MKLNLFIQRPVLSSVIAIMTLLLGMIAAYNLPISQYPSITPPTIMISVQYPGASAETIQRTVATQIENQLNGINDLLYMSSNSSGSGGAIIVLTFEVGTDLNYAINDVLNRVHASMPLLPSIVQKLGVIVRKSSSDMLLSLRFYNTGSLDNQYMNNYLQRTLYNDLELIQGVGSVSQNGARNYAIRIWLNINKMNALNISTNEVATAIKDQSQQYTIGKSEGNNSSLQVNISGPNMLSSANQFDNIVIRNTGTQIIYLKNIAKIELGAQSYNTVAISTFKNQQNKIEHREVLNMQIFTDSAANQLEVKDKVLSLLNKSAKNFPEGLNYYVAFDATQFVSNSIKNVLNAMRDASILVGLVILLFLHNIRASIIAIITVPISIIGTFALLYLFGYSINTLTLFAMILAIGIVVDDSIVMIENIERIKQNHPNKTLFNIIELSIKEVLPAVMAISLVLSVVFLPVLALSGLSGVLYKQFAITIACSVILSALCAITITPSLCGLILTNHETENKFSKKFNQLFEKFTNVYVNCAEKLINLGKYNIIIFLIIAISTTLIFKIIPLSFVPNEDQGYFFVGINLPSSASLATTQKQTESILSDIVKIPGVKETTSIIGIDQLSGGGPSTSATTLQVMLNNWDQRSTNNLSADNIIKQVNKLNAKYKNATIRAYNQPPIRGLSTTGGVEFFLEDRTNGDSVALQKIATQLTRNLLKHKEIQQAFALIDNGSPQVIVTPDVDRAKNYKVEISNIYSTLQTIYSTSNINFAYMMQGLVWIIMQADYPFRNDLNRLSNIYIKNLENKIIPINNVVTTKQISQANVLQRFNDYLATKVTVMPAEGYSSGDIMTIIQKEIKKLPTGYDYDWFGTSFQQIQSQSTTIYALIFSIVMIFLLLAALYEMWRLPIVVLMGIPFALFGSGLMLLLSAKSNDLYFQISLLTLLGLSAKNIILLIEFAWKTMQEGHTAKYSILHALRLRLRPIIMTSVTFIAGAIPLTISHGAGSNAQHSVGTGIIGGMIGSVVLATMIIPSFFVIIMKNYIKN